MNLIEAIKEAQETGKWFRPVSWSWHEAAFCIQESKYGDKFTFSVSGLNRGQAHMTSFLDDLIGDWEVVSPDDVLEGR